MGKLTSQYFIGLLFLLSLFVMIGSVIMAHQQIQKLLAVNASVIETLSPLTEARLDTLRAILKKTEGKTQRDIKKFNANILQFIESMNQEEMAVLKQRHLLSVVDAEKSNLAVMLLGAAGGFLLLMSVVLLSYHFAERRRAERKQQELENRLKKIIDGSNDLIAALDLDHRFIAFNKIYEKQFERLFANKIKLGMYLHEAFAHYPAKEKMIAAWQRALAGGEFTVLNHFKADDKHVFYYETTYSTIRDANNQLIGAAHIMRDVTERKHVENLKNEFVSIVSHELRTPLTSIRGSLGLVLGGLAKNLDEKTLSMLNIAYNNCERLVTLINDILDIEKIEAGRLDFQLKVFDLNKLAEEAVLTNQGYCEKFNLTMNLLHSPMVLLVNADYNRVIQVLTNLISNAAKFAPNGSEVKITLTDEGNMGRVSVTDFGPGVPVEFQKQLFEKFSQADSSAIRKHGGSGLGLSISKAIIDNLKGHIGYHAHLPAGTTFYFELPLWKAEHAGDEQTQAKKNKMGKADAVKRKKILYVEDDFDLSRVIVDILQQEAEVSSVINKEQALEILKETHFDLILLDLKLPDGWGYDLLPKLKDLNIPVVVFTAYDLPIKYYSYVASTLIKSKTTNQKLIATIRAAL